MHGIEQMETTANKGVGVGSHSQSSPGPQSSRQKHKHTFKLHEISQFDQFKITEIVATRSNFLKLKCTKFDLGWVPPQTPLGELTALPQTL